MVGHDDRNVPKQQANAGDGVQRKGSRLAVLFEHLAKRSPLGPTISKEEEQGVKVILKAFEGAPISWLAYAMATAYHETAGTMQPINERGSATYFTRMYDVQGPSADRARRHGNTEPGDGIKYRGRGYVQLTWKCNYEKAGKALGIDLVARPELALEADVAAEIMRRGMCEGWFTGRTLKGYLHADRATREQFIYARQIINGRDRAEDIADYALAFQEALYASMAS